MTAVHSERYGSGKALVMLHGWAMHSGVWREFAQQLGRHCRVVCVDLPGHGRSETVTPYTLDNLAQTLLEALEVEEFALLGWSLGATLALAMAERAPERVNRLILMAGNPHFIQTGDWPGMADEVLDGFTRFLGQDAAQTLARFLALQVNGLAYGKPMLRHLKAALEQSPPPSSEVLQAGLRILKESDLRSVLGRCKQPVRLILGDRDRLVPSSLANCIATINSAVDVTVLQNAGHAPFLSHADQLSELITGDLA